MSFAGRTFPDIGAKLLALRPLAKQMVHPDGSLLGPHARSRLTTAEPGLNFETYRDLIQQSFRPEFWNSSQTIESGSRRYELMAYNFALFFGIAVQMYEATLTDDRVRFERAPFDHPQLCVPDGHPGDSSQVSAGAAGQAAGILLAIPAVGAAGNLFPLRTFAERLQGINENRAHANLQPCSIPSLR
ncbi:MAG: hypothetical protein FJW20_05685 [Acidimicrobiia bacterium]|nr:hypothetical protein [Acidimicrobiia bacterium]